MASNQIHNLYPSVQAEEDDGDEDIWRAQRQLDDWVEEQKDLYKQAYCNGNNEMVKISNQNCFECFEKPSVYAFQQFGQHCI